MADQNTYSDTLVTEIGGLAAVRTGDDRSFRIIRLSDGMTLQTIGDRDAAIARAQELVARGHCG